MVRCFFLVQTLWLLVSPSQSTHAQTQRAVSVDAGISAYEQADFENAIAIFFELVSEPGTTADDVLTAHRYLAALRYFMGDETAALEHARSAIARTPTAVPPDGAGSAVFQLFDEARQEQISQPLPARHEQTSQLLPALDLDRIDTPDSELQPEFPSQSLQASSVDDSLVDSTPGRRRWPLWVGIASALLVSGAALGLLFGLQNPETETVEGPFAEGLMEF